MRKRLRKKLHKGEFNWLFFSLKAQFDPPLEYGPGSEMERLVDSYIDLTESLGLCSGGSFTPNGVEETITFFIPMRRKPNGDMPYRCGHCTEAHRKALYDWLNAQPKVELVVVSPLTPMF